MINIKFNFVFCCVIAVSMLAGCGEEKQIVSSCKNEKGVEPNHIYRCGTMALSQNFNAQKIYLDFLGKFYSATGNPPANINCNADFAVSPEDASFAGWHDGNCTGCSFNVKYEKSGETTRIYDVSANTVATCVKSGVVYDYTADGKTYKAQNYTLTVDTTICGVPGKTFHYLTQATVVAYK